MEYMEEHHLYPGKRRRAKVDRKTDTILVCVDCGDQIHLMFDNRDLRSKLDSLEALQGAMTTFTGWVKKMPLGRRVNMKAKKRKR